MNNQNKIYWICVGLFLSCVGFWIGGYKDLANHLVVAPVTIAVLNMFVLGRVSE